MKLVVLDVIDDLYANREIFISLFFFGVVFLTSAAILLGRRRRVRRGYLAVFFSLLVLMNVVPVTVLPIQNLHKFSSGAPQETAEYRMYVEDSSGRELRVDNHSLSL